MAIKTAYWIVAAILMIVIAGKMSEIFTPLSYIVNDLTYCILVLFTYCIYFVLVVWVMIQIPEWIESVSHIGTIVWLFGMNALGYYIPEVLTNHINSLSSKKCTEKNPRTKAVCDVLLCITLITIVTIALSPLIGGKVPWR